MKIEFKTIKNIYFNKTPLIRRNVLPSLKNDTFEYTNNPFFKGSRCSEGGFQPRNIPNLRCPVCGLIMIDREQQKEFVSDVAGKRGEDLASALEKYEDETVFLKDETKSKKRTIYRPKKQEVVNIIKDLARKNPELTLAQLVALEAKTCLDNLIEKQMNVVNELKEYLQQAPLSSVELIDIQTIIDEYEKQILGLSNIEFKRKNFVHALSNTAQDSAAQAKITEIISKLPTSDTEINSFFVKYSKGGRTSKDIARKLVDSNIPTAEHLVPKSKGGKNNTSNYICDCQDCNSLRGNIPFNQWIKTIPDFQENLQDYLIAVQEAVTQGKLDQQYDSYAEEIAQTIHTLSGGTIELKDPRIDEDEAHRALMEKRKIEINKIKDYMRTLGLRKKSLRKEIALLEHHPQFRSIVQFGIISYQINELKRKITQNPQENLKRKLSQLQSQKEAIGRSITPKEEFNQKIEEYKLLLDSMTSINDEIINLQAQVEPENALLKESEKLNHEITHLKAQNQSILSSSKFDMKKGEEDYKNYLLYQKVLERAKSLEKKYLNNKEQYETIITQMAQIQLEETLRKLRNSENVKYFINQDIINQDTAKKTEIENQLKLIEELKEQIKALEEQLHALGDDLTIEEVRQKYEEALSAKDTIEKIEHIAELRDELSAVEDTIRYNEGILDQLRQYRLMNPEKFTKLINLAYINHESTI